MPDAIVEPGRRPHTVGELARLARVSQVELRFLPDGSGTRVELVSDKWENWGRNAHRARKGYDVGWAYVLNIWAGGEISRASVETS